MIERSGAKSLRIVFVPRHMHARIALHSIATATGVVVAVRMGSGGPWWTAAAWYCGSFVGSHVVMVPFMAAWLMAKDRVEKWVRGIIEEELIRFDLQSYERQLTRVFPGRKEEPPEPSA